jgi:acetate kinase
MVTATSSAVLAVNVGSSSVKCALFTVDAEPQLLVRTTFDGGASSCAPSLLDWVDRETRHVPLKAIGHRIVHGGPNDRGSQRITPAVLDTLTQLIPFAPNHLPDEIALVNTLGRHRASVPQIACFDTAFHADLPEVTKRLAIPAAYDARGIRRYGFHGLSYAFLLRELERIAGSGAAAGRVILAHLGNGSSLAAVSQRRSVDTTMAFTPIGGVVMSTRSGDLDPGVVTYLARTEHLSADELEDLLSFRAGLLGISGTSGDMRTLLAQEQTEHGRLAVEIYAYSVKKAIGAFAAALGGLDTLVFSGGIGEHAPSVRARICDGLAHLGIQLDPGPNAASAAIISAAAAAVTVRVIPTDEELMIAEEAYRVLAVDPI